MREIILGALGVILEVAVWSFLIMLCATLVLGGRP